MKNKKTRIVVLFDSTFAYTAIAIQVSNLGVNQVGIIVRQRKISRSFSTDQSQQRLLGKREVEPDEIMSSALESTAASE